MNHRACFTLLAFGLITGCAGMSQSMQRSGGMGQVQNLTVGLTPETEKPVVVLKQAWVASAERSLIPKTKVGFAWGDVDYDSVVMTVSSGVFVSRRMDSAKMTVDGRIYALEEFSDDALPNSTQAFIVPLSALMSVEG